MHAIELSMRSKIVTTRLESTLCACLLLCSLAQLAACSGTSSPRTETATTTTSSTELPSPEHQAQIPCELSFPSYGGNVSPGMEHDVVLYGAPVTIQFTSNGIIADARVHRPFDFSAPALIESLDLRTTKVLEVEGLANIAKGATLLNVEKTPDGLVAQARIGPSSASSGGFPIVISPVRLECEDIAGDQPPPVDDEGRLDEWFAKSPTGGLSVVRANRLELQSQPNREKNIIVEPLPSGLHDPEVIPLFVVESRDGMSRVKARWSEGSSFFGWLPSSLISVPTAEEREAIEQSFDKIGSLSTIGYGTGRGIGQVTYKGPASIQPGTPVYWEPGDDTPWATVVDSEDYEVAWKSGSPWVTIAKAPLLGRLRTLAHVEKTKVTFLDVQ